MMIDNEHESRTPDMTSAQHDEARLKAGFESEWQAHADAQSRTQAEAQAVTERAAWMRDLALSAPHELAAAMATLGNLPTRQWLRPPETGMTMVQGRSGGTGARFNLGEMTVTRCAVTLSEGAVGVAYVKGRSASHAEQAALADALMQLPDWRERIECNVLTPLRLARDARRAARGQAIEQTRVDFFTLERGDNNA